MFIEIRRMALKGPLPRESVSRIPQEQVTVDWPAVQFFIQLRGGNCVVSLQLILAECNYTSNPPKVSLVASVTLTGNSIPAILRLETTRTARKCSSRP